MSAVCTQIELPELFWNSQEFYQVTEIMREPKEKIRHGLAKLETSFSAELS